MNTHSPAEAPAEAPEFPPDPGEWYFTFGSGQRIYAGHPPYSDGPPTVGAQGFEVFGYYVKIRGDFHTARTKMYETFGGVWCDQYDKLPTDEPGQTPPGGYKLLLEL